MLSLREKDSICFHKFHDLVSNKHHTLKLLNNFGIVLFEDLYDSTLALEMANELGEIYFSIDANKSGITEISNFKTGRNKINSFAFTKQSLFPHTDRSPVCDSPSYLINWCQIPACKGGKIVLSSVDEIVNYMKFHNLHKTLDVLQRDDIAVFSDSINNYKGPILKNNNGVWEVRFRYDSCASFNSKFSHEIDLFRDVVSRVSIELFPSIGDGYIINNKIYLHGRGSFEGNRLVSRIQIA